MGLSGGDWAMEAAGMSSAQGRVWGLSSGTEGLACMGQGTQARNST